MFKEDGLDLGSHNNYPHKYLILHNRVIHVSEQIQTEVKENNNYLQLVIISMNFGLFKHLASTVFDYKQETNLSQVYVNKLKLLTLSL